MEKKLQPCFMIIDLKSFYASVECVDRGLDPMTALLAVADKERSIELMRHFQELKRVQAALGRQRGDRVLM